MDKEEIIKELKKNAVIKGSRSMLEYERAKKLLINGPISAREYDFIIRVITKHLEI